MGKAPRRALLKKAISGLSLEDSSQSARHIKEEGENG